MTITLTYTTITLTYTTHAAADLAYAEYIARAAFLYEYNIYNLNIPQEITRYNRTITMVFGS